VVNDVLLEFCSIIPAKLPTTLHIGARCENWVPTSSPSPFSSPSVFHMPFPFRLLCDLLERLERNARRSSSIGKIQERDTILVWFNKHNAIIPRRGPEAVTFLSYLFPERRPDRIFGLQERQVEGIIQRAQCLGSSRMKELQRWKTSGGLDFASSVERVMSTTDCESRAGPEVRLQRFPG
jgi:DNA ligase-4